MPPIDRDRLDEASHISPDKPSLLRVPIVLTLSWLIVKNSGFIERATGRAAYTGDAQEEGVETLRTDEDTIEADLDKIMARLKD